MPLLPPGRRPLPGQAGPPPGLAGPPGVPPAPPTGGLDALGGGPAPVPQLGGGLGLGGPPQGGPQFPSLDPGAVSQLMQPLDQQQQVDQQDFLAQQQQTALLSLIAGMKTQPNPAAQAAVTEPGYPTPPSPDQGAM